MNNFQEINTSRFDHLQQSIDSLSSMIKQMATVPQGQNTTVHTGRVVSTLGKCWGDNPQPGHTESLW